MHRASGDEGQNPDKNIGCLNIQIKIYIFKCTQNWGAKTSNNDRLISDMFGKIFKYIIK